MKKMLLATALFLLQDVLQADVYCSKQTGSSSTKGNHHPSFLRFWNWAKLSMQPKFVAAQKMLLKQKPANIRQTGLLGFVNTGIYTPLLEARVYCSQ